MYPWQVCPRKKAGTLCSPEASYLIVGGTGSHGRNITSRLAEKGAQRIIVISRTGSKDQGVGMPVRELSANGATVVVYQCDVSSKEEVEGKLVSKLPHIPPVRGVIYGVMVLRVSDASYLPILPTYSNQLTFIQDTSFEHMSYSEYDAVVKPKVAGVWKIHHAFLGLNCDLDLFITLSSIASLVGNRGQAAYAAGGTFMSAFGHNRNSVGLPCTTIDLGPVQGIGYLAENEQRKTDVADTLSVDWIDDTELHRLLAAATTGDLANTCQHHCITGLGALQSMTVKKK